ncbi:MAG TPA: L-histidine N(alpha)-methyltransferase [Rhodothermales bacterium]|nr:L-histidine N(alpha)-methyltransferase [Rhodothermales bacterium]
MPSPPPAPPPPSLLLQDALAGLLATPKTLPSKYFYDEEGSALFETITRLDAYYPTRTERGILERHVGEIARAVGPRAAIIEYGSGSSEKTRLLLDALDSPAAYVPIDISADFLLVSAEQLRTEYPGLPVLPVEADYTRPFKLPELPTDTRRRVVFFPGSTLGNFLPDEATAFLKQAGELAGPNGGLILGVDLKKDRAVLGVAYDDPEGVTAQFNKNLLVRLNRELGADFDVDAFDHHAPYNEAEGRVEMHLVSRYDQTVHLDGHAIPFRARESIHTENSYKYDLGELVPRAATAGLTLEGSWTDPAGWFAVLFFNCSLQRPDA